MELRQLRSLVALADERHFTRAAARLHIAQPALSQQVKRLEAEVGVALVDRTTRHVALTEAGERLVARARRALAEVEAASAELSELAGVRTGRVVIGAMRSTGPFDLSGLIAAFHDRHPGIELVVQEEPSEVMLQQLHADAVDLAFLSVNRLDPGPDLRLHRFLDEPLVALLPPGHALAGRRRMDMARVARRALRRVRRGRLAAPDRRAGRARGGLRAGARLRVDRERADPRDGVARARRRAAAGLRGRARGAAGGMVPVRRPALARDVTLAWREARRPSPAARAFLDLALTAGAGGVPGPRHPGPLAWPA